jgi:hypothetical protein
VDENRRMDDERQAKAEEASESRWEAAPLLMLSESGVSAISILLVTARAVNIFK